MLKNSVLIVLFIIFGLLVFTGAKVGAETFQEGDIRFVKYTPWRCFEAKLFPFSKFDPNGKDVIVRCECYKNRQNFNCDTKGIKTYSGPAVRCWHKFLTRNGGWIYFKHYRSETETRKGMWEKSSFSRENIYTNKGCRSRYRKISREFDLVKQKRRL